MPTDTDAQAESYELIIRQISWVVLLLLAATTPIGKPQTIPMFILISLGLICNATRYSPWLMRNRWYTSFTTVLIFENLFVAILLILAGRTDMAYTGLLGLTIVAATFWYGMRGALTVVIGQFIVLGIVSVYHPYPSLPTDTVRSCILAVGVLVILGVLVARLTRIRRIERVTLDSTDAQLHSADASLHALANTSSNPTVIVSPDGVVTLVNNALRELLPQQDSTATLSLSDLLQVYNKQGEPLNWREALELSPLHLKDITLTTVDGAKPIELSVTTISIHEQPNGYIVVCKDVSSEQTLDQQRSSFIAIASHELRTPLAQIEGALSVTLMPQSSLPDQTRTILTKAHDSTLFLSTLVQDLTTLFLAQNGALDAHVKSVDPRQIVGQLMTDFSGDARQKGLTLDTDVLPNTPTVLTTEFHVLHILRNLVSNALKYTDTGRVIVRAEPGQDGGVKFSVQDTGRGISQQNQQKLFTHFFQAEDFTTRENGGTGIGLYLSSQLAQRINAHLWCDSKLGEGSIFYLEVPPFSQLKQDRREVVTAGVNSLLEQI